MDSRSRGARPQRGMAEQAVSGSGQQPRRGDATAAAGGGRRAGESNPQAGDEDAGESSQDNRGHNLRPRRRTAARYLDEEETYDSEDLDEEDEGAVGGATGGTSGTAGDDLEKKKVGRPIAYKGDPNSPHLTEDERRRIKRRIANRESARRVRQKRQDVMEDLQTKINALQSQNQRLMAHVGEVEAHKGMLTGQVATLRSKWTTASNDNLRLQAELSTLRKTLQMQQANLELLQRGSAAAGPAAQQQLPGAAQQPGTPTAADIFGNLAAFYGLPSAAVAHGGGAVSGAAAPAPGLGQGLGGLSNTGPSAFSPIQPLHSAPSAGAPGAFAPSRQPSDAWNFLHAAARLGSGSLGLPGMGSFGSGQLAEGLGLGLIASSSALNIAALNPAGSGRLPDLTPLNPAGSGRLPDLALNTAGSGRLSDALGGLGSPASGAEPAPRSPSAGQTLVNPVAHLAERPQPQQPPPAASAAAAAAAAQQQPREGEDQLGAARGSSSNHPTPFTARAASREDLSPRERLKPGQQVGANGFGSREGVATSPALGRPSMHEVSALMFLKGSDAAQRNAAAPARSSESQQASSDGTDVTGGRAPRLKAGRRTEP